MKTERVDAAPQWAALVDGVLARQPRALARAITAIENDVPGAAGLVAALRPHGGRARIVGVTGPPGAGKSTLIDALVREWRARGRTVAVLAVDPSSPVSGGAILGDRVRMSRHAGDPGVFVRSLASRGHLGGLVRAVAGVVQATDAFGPDVIVLETVGAGQSEVEFADHAQVRLVLCPPGLGDDVQAMKAGVLEVADVLVVNKADDPRARDTERQLASMLALRDPAAPAARIASTVATTGEGVAALVDAIDAVPACDTRPGAGDAVAARLRRRFADALAAGLRAQVLAGSNATLDAVLARLARGELRLDDAVAQGLAALARTAAPPAGNRTHP